MTGAGDPDTLARAVAAAMEPRDVVLRTTGMVLEEVRAGHARVSMPVRAEMLNSHGLCHGGLIFTLADTAFAYACNSHNVPTVAQHCSITFVSPGRQGDVLTATAEEHHRGNRTGLTDVTIANQDGQTIAVFRGHSYALRGTILADGS